MEGIPEADVKEHERQRNGRAGSPSSGEDEPGAKRLKPEGLLGNAPGMRGNVLTPGMPGHPMNMGQYHPSMHMMSHMGHSQYMQPG